MSLACPWPISRARPPTRAHALGLTPWVFLWSVSRGLGPVSQAQSPDVPSSPLSPKRLTPKCLSPKRLSPLKSCRSPAASAAARPVFPSPQKRRRRRRPTRGMFLPLRGPAWYARAASRLAPESWRAGPPPPSRGAMRFHSMVAERWLDTGRGGLRRASEEPANRRPVNAFQPRRRRGARPTSRARRLT